MEATVERHAVDPIPDSSRHALTARRFPPAVAWCLALLIFNPLGGQTRIELSEAATCGDCEFLLEPFASLHGHPDGMLFDYSRLLVDSLGFLYAIDTRGPNVLIFDRTGRFLDTFRASDGSPEHALSAAFAAGPDGSLHLFSNEVYGRFSHTGEVQNVLRFPLGTRVHAAVPLDSGRLLINADIPSRESAGFSLHLLERSGVVRSFDDVTYRLDAPWLTRRRLAVGADGRIWAAAANRYDIRSWTSAATEADLVITRSAGWFRPWLSHPSPMEPPPPRIWDIHIDGDFLWVHSIIAGPSWRPPVPVDTGRATSPEHGQEVQYRRDFNERDSMVSTVIDVVNLRTGQLFASKQLPGVLSRIAGSELVYHVREASDGSYAFDISRLSLSASPPKEPPSERRP